MADEIDHESAGDREMTPVPAGRRKHPAAVRKITACVACRRLKIKCHMPNSGAPPCTRCSKRGSRCAVSDSPRMVAEDDILWRSSVTRRMGTFEEFMHNTNRQLSAIQGQLRKRSHDNPSGPRHEDTCLPSAPAANGQQVVESQEDGEMRMDVDRGPAIIPSSSISSISEPIGSNRRYRRVPEDLIHLGILTLDQTQTLFDIYAHRLDHYLYQILGRPVTLPEVRKSSRVLLAAVCTVGALHCPELAQYFDSCYQHYRSVAADIALSRDSSLDDIRGLCIGAFWLRDIAWNLSSIAVTLATQQHLHQASLKNITSGGPSLHERIRLYYLVYICDHHFSISYGRPPMTGESDLISSSRDFADAPMSTEDDTRLVSQVQMWSIATQGLNLMGFDVDIPVSEDLIPPIRRLMISLDTWRANWYEQFGHNAHVGNYPRKGVKLHYHFARLYLCSHAYRGLDLAASRPMNDTASLSPYTHTQGHENTQARRVSSSSGQTSTAGQLHMDLEEIAAAAVDSAQTILRIITSDVEIQSHLNGLPLYFDTMIAFAIVFLFKVATRYPTYVRIGTAGVLDLIRDMAETLKGTTKGMHRRHFLAALSPAVDKLLNTHTNDGQANQQAHEIPVGEWQPNANAAVSQPEFLQGMGYQHPDKGFGWSPEDFDWTNYDFLANSNDLAGTFSGYNLNI